MNVYTKPSIHVIVIAGEETSYAHTCLQALMGQTLTPEGISLFVSVGQTDLITLVTSHFPSVRMLRVPKPLSYAAGCNRAAAAVIDCDFIAMLDLSVMPSLGWLEQIAKTFLMNEKLGVLGCKMLDRDVETIRDVGVTYSDNGLPYELGRGEPDRGQYRQLMPAYGVHPGAMAVRVNIWRKLGGFDERFNAAYYDGLDFCERVRRAGWEIAVDGRSTVTHFNPWNPDPHDQEGLVRFFMNRAHFMRKHYSWVQWLKFFKSELRWLKKSESRGCRQIAFKTLLRGALFCRPTTTSTHTFGVSRG